MEKQSQRSSVSSLAILTLAFVSTFVAACSSPKADSAPTIDLASMYGGSVERPDLTDVTPLTASGPTNLRFNERAVITASGGMPPYTYRLAAGKGQLTNTTYVSPSEQEIAAIIVIDSVGQIASVTITVTESGVVPTAPTPLPQAAPSSALQTSMPDARVVNRNCDLNGLAALGTNRGDEMLLAHAIHYEWCLLLGRNATQQEHYIWYKNIPKKKLDPNNLPLELFRSSEFNQRYGNLSMAPTDAVILLSRLLIYRDPTAAEAQQLTGAFSVGGQEGVLKAIMSSEAFLRVHPFLQLAQNRMASF